ncbi:ras GTPase-activating-like protein IQGAP2 isoform X2 [Corticium candelabrum]|uniref:ras GTPase-activating-like protein IQGAP2 isoform X2 n=1 Tax=Corticium candelabrum TaxID=121492 RepID=UPI002E25E33E|nr:ras GTPase-activating-like protein IQGAP2 isoform X2 [Corticium candelabrum]
MADDSGFVGEIPGTGRASGAEMDMKRKEQIAYEYLCRLEEAKQWMEACLKDELPATTEMEEALRTGVILARLANFFAPERVPLKRVYDLDGARFEKKGLHFKHTDNINYWVTAMTSVGMPQIFFPTTTDIYDRKNMPKCVYCIHALSIYLYKLGKAPQIQDLHGIAEFTEEEISAMQRELEKYGIQMPAFGKIGGLLANELSVDEAAVHAAILAINEAIVKGVASETLLALNNPAAGLLGIEASNSERYQELLTAAKAAKEEKAETLKAASQVEGENGDVYDHILTKAEIQEALSGVNETVKQEVAKRRFEVAIDAINEAIDCQDLDALMDAFLNPNASLAQVEELNANYYMDGLVARKAEKSATAEQQVALTHEEIQSALLVFNVLAQEDRELAAAVAFVNVTIDKNDSVALLTALKLPGARLTDVQDKQAVHYLAVLAAAKTNKREIFDDKDAALDQHEIQDGVNRANSHADVTFQFATSVATVNAAIDAGDAAATLAALGSKSLKVKNITEECADLYQERLKAAKDEKVDSVVSASSWSEYQTSEGHSFYHNPTTGESSWSRPEGYDGTTTDLSHSEIQSIVSMATADFDRETLLKSKEPLIVQLQARVRGVLLRRRFKDRLRYMRGQEASVVKLQAHWKGQKQRKKFKARKEYMHDNLAAIIKIQSYVRGWLARRQYQRRLKYMNDNVAAVVKIQSWFRGYRGRQLYKKLMGADKPPVETVRRFLHLLEQSDIDFSEELELQKLKAQVVTEIRGNQQLESDLNVMDIKIGLLVRNRLELQDVVNHGRRLKRRRRDDVSQITHPKGLKTLDKESRQRLEAYQHLFYLLQTNPNYFAKLIFEMPQSKTTKFMENVILTVFNYASNQREEYLMLKLFETALKEEVASKVDELKEIITGNPTVIKMVVHFNRGARGQSQLRDLLEPLVSDIIGDRSLVIHTSPVDVYKAWINQMEQETGQPSKLPYEVSNDQALSHIEVKERMADTIQALKRVVTKFLNSILQSVSKIPYGMRYVAMQLRLALAEKFPDASEDEILKVVGNLIYYRYMNPAIVAPDAFDIVSLSADKGLTPDQRRNLGSIAKVLQYAAANKLFEGENAALVAINPYIQEAFVKFKSFFLRASTVEDAEIHFSIDEYTDVVTLTKPTIYISVKEMISTHSLLLEHETAVAAEQDDPIHDVLRDLGPVPDAQTLLGVDPVYAEPPAGGRPLTEEQIRVNQAKLEEQGKTEMSLTLTSKFERFEDDDTDMKALFVRTKRLVVDVLRTQTGDNLNTILYTPATEEQEDEHQQRIKKRSLRQDEAKHRDSDLKRSHSVHGDAQLPLEGMKRKIQRNLRLLEGDGLVSSENNYQEIVNAIARDIRNQHRYRQQRKRELARLYQTIGHLNGKAKFFEDQINYYQQYIKMCLANLAKAKGKASGRLFSKQHSDAQQAVRKSIRYSGQKLYDKGVIQDIEGLPPHQLKNVSFEITATDVGVFDVSAKFLGVSMEKVELVFQDLLQLQYEGVTVMKMFGKAKINVNLLIFLINKKFYGK